MTVPLDGIWEIPLWITWLQAFLKTSIKDLDLSVNIRVIDLSRKPFQDFNPQEYFNGDELSDLYIFSPLLQNYDLTQKVADFLREKGTKVAIGGVMSSFVDPMRFDYVFTGRIEQNYPSFLSIISDVYQVRTPVIEFSFSRFEKHISYEWAKHYVNRVIYLRLFTQFGCPLNCSFCSDRRTGVDIVPLNIVEKELQELHKTFPAMDVLYIGDLTFGVNKYAIEYLEKILVNLKQKFRIEYKLIIQTNPSLISQPFLDELKRLNVKVIEMGIESGSVTSVKRLNKKRPSTEWLESRIHLILKNDIGVAGNIIVGLPDDQEEDYFGTIEWINKWKEKIWFNLYGYVPYFNTPLYQRLKQDDRIRNWNFSDWCEGKELVFEPYNISRSRVREFFLEVLNQSIK